jgi:hypothetical protein
MEIFNSPLNEQERYPEDYDNAHEWEASERN